MKTERQTCLSFSFFLSFCMSFCPSVQLPSSIWLSAFLPNCLSVFLSFSACLVCVSSYPSVCLSIHLSTCPSLSLPFPFFLSVLSTPVSPSFYLYTCQSIILSVHLSVCLSVCLSLCLAFSLSFFSIFLSVFLSISLSICLSLRPFFCL